jgi:hypothetical protein
MTIVRLRFTGVSPGTLQRNVRLQGIGSGELSFHAHPARSPRERRSRIPTVAGCGGRTDDR